MVAVSFSTQIRPHQWKLSFLVVFFMSIFSSKRRRTWLVARPLLLVTVTINCTSHCAQTQLQRERCTPDLRLQDMLGHVDRIFLVCFYSWLFNHRYFSSYKGGLFQEQNKRQLSGFNSCNFTVCYTLDLTPTACDVAASWLLQYNHLI